MSTKLVLAAVVAGAFAYSAFAQDGEVVGSLTEEETEEVAAFGRDMGHALQCTPKERQAELLDDLRAIFHFVSADVGTDSAFLYAITLGVGATEKNDEVNCEELLADLQETLDAFELTGADQ